MSFIGFFTSSGTEVLKNQEDEFDLLISPVLAVFFEKSEKNRGILTLIVFIHAQSDSN